MALLVRLDTSVFRSLAIVNKSLFPAVAGPVGRPFSTRLT